MTTRELYAKIIAESELLQLALNEIHTFCFQHWSRSRGTCGTGSGAPEQHMMELEHMMMSRTRPYMVSYSHNSQ